MSIRLRMIPGVGLIAICAARSVEKEGDVYLDDDAHHALSRKFDDDFASMGFMAQTYEEDDVSRAVEAEESNNPSRTWWDNTYGPRVPPNVVGSVPSGEAERSLK